MGIWRLGAAIIGITLGSASMVSGLKSMGTSSFSSYLIALVVWIVMVFGFSSYQKKKAKASERSKQAITSRIRATTTPSRIRATTTEVDEEERRRHREAYEATVKINAENAVAEDPLEDVNKCQKCAADNPSEAVFCLKCGNKLGITLICPECGTENQPEAKFCMGCGQER